MKFKVKDVVYDSWWPWRVGSIIKVLKTRLHIEWADGKIWIYDLAHMKFLRTL